jgi:hypothetical protein
MNEIGAAAASVGPEFRMSEILENALAQLNQGFAVPSKNNDLPWL